MSTRQTALVLGEFYHIYNRGTDKRTIFLDCSDYQRFIDLLYICNTSVRINIRDVRKLHENVFNFARPDKLVAIAIYCLMPNHFHLLITPTTENGVSLFMNKLSTAYTMYFNKRYVRTGSLFQGVFKSQHADTDEYLKYLYAYIHLNPVKLIDKNWKEQGAKDAAKSFDFAASYSYSSLPDYLGTVRDTGLILDKQSFPDYFFTAQSMGQELFGWLNFDHSLGEP